MKKVKEVVVFSTTWCPYCKMEDSWLDANNVQHRTILVDENDKAAMYIAQKTGQRSVPVTEIIFDDDSHEYVVGFDRPRLTSLLGV
jgi:glutaredoxin